MADQDLIGGLIGTYRELNLRVRPMAEDRLRLGGAESGSIRETVTRLRDSELRFSQALKERVTGVPMSDLFSEDDAPVLGTEGLDDSTAAIISQFGTARESTLALLRSLPAEEWDQTLEGGEPIRMRIRQLHENDRRHMERIVGLLGSP